MLRKRRPNSPQVSAVLLGPKPGGLGLPSREGAAPAPSRERKDQSWLDSLLSGSPLKKECVFPKLSSVPAVIRTCKPFLHSQILVTF